MVGDTEDNVYRCVGEVEGGEAGDAFKSGRVRLSKVHGCVQGRETGTSN